MELAVATGIPPAVWADEGERAIATAVELLRKQSGGSGQQHDDQGRQMSG